MTFQPGQRVRYRVRRLGKRASEHVVFGVATVRGCVNFDPHIFECERDDGSPVRFDGIGLYAHELHALERIEAGGAA